MGMKVAPSADVHQAYRCATLDIFAPLARGPMLPFDLPIAVMIFDTLYTGNRLLPAATPVFDVVRVQSRIKLDILELEHGSASDNV